MRATFHLFPLTSWSHAKELFFSPRMKLFVIKGTRLTISRGLARVGGEMWEFFFPLQNEM